MDSGCLVHNLITSRNGIFVPSLALLPRSRRYGINSSGGCTIPTTRTRYALRSAKSKVQMAVLSSGDSRTSNTATSDSIRIYPDMTVNIYSPSWVPI